MTLAALLATALAARLGAGWVLPVETLLDRLPDQREYLDLGQSLLRGDGLILHDARFGDEVRAYRAPGYALWVATGAGSVRAVRAMQAVIDTSTVLAVYLLARRWLTAASALAAAALAAFNPFMIYLSILILSETLFTAMLAWAMVLLTRPGPGRGRGAGPTPGPGSGPGRAGWIVGVGLLAVSVLVRPSAIALPILLGVGATLVTARRAALSTGTGGRGSWLAAGPGAIAMALTIAVMLPWAWRNHRVLGTWIWTTTNGGITAYDGFNPDATGASDQAIFLRDMPWLAHNDWTEVQRDRYFAERARAYAMANPWRAIRLAGSKIARTWSPVPLSDDYGHGVYFYAGLLYSLPVQLLTLWGLVVCRRLSPGVKVFLMIPAVYFTLVHAMSVGSLRYRIPAEPPLMVIAASALSRPGCQVEPAR